MLNTFLATIGLLTCLLVFVSKRIREWPVSEPLIATLLGVLMGPRLLGWVDFSEPAQPRVLLEASRLLLAVSLMGIALRYPFDDIRRRAGRVAFLLVTVMPGMAVVSALLGGWVLGLSASLAWVLGACVAPTDPVLASSVVNGESAEKLVPARLRQLLSLESGANDGLAFPLVVIGIALYTSEHLSSAVWTSVWGVVGAAVTGAAIGVLAGRTMRAARRDDDAEESVRLLFAVALALFVLGATKLAGMDGLLAVFVAGLAYNASVSGGERSAESSIDEAMNRFVVLPLFTLLGIALPWATWGEMGWPVAVFAVAVLVLRRLPLILALRRPLQLDLPAAVFYGWFGPIGASALFYLMHAHDHGVVDSRVFGAGSAVVAVSVVAHGVTAAWGRKVYARTERQHDVATG